MSRLTPILLVALVLVAAPTFAQKVYIDYAKDFDFSSVKTFMYKETPDTDAGTSLDDQRIESAIFNALEEGGIERVDSGGDIIVTYHVTTEEQTQFNTTTYGYGGWGPGWGGYGRWGYGWGGTMGMGGATTTTSTFVEGTIVIDAFEPEKKELVWRGMSTITVKDNPEKRAKQIDKIMAKLEKKWQKILKNEGK